MLASSWEFIVENWDCHKESIQFKFGGFIILSSSSWWWVGRHRYKFWEEEVPEQNAFLPMKPSCFWLVLQVCSYTCVNVEKLFIIWFSYITLFLGHNWLFMQCLQFLAKTFHTETLVWRALECILCWVLYQQMPALIGICNGMQWKIQNF